MADTQRIRLYVAPPVPTSTEFSSVEQVQSVLAQHENGRFRMSALLCERMLRNPRFASVLRTRLSGLMSAEVRFEPARENRDARRAAREFGEDWPAIVSAARRKKLRKWSLMLGVGFGQRALRMSPTSGRQIYTLQPYWPGFASWYWAEGGYRIQTYDAGVIDVGSPVLKEVSMPSPTQTGLINPSAQPWVIDEPNGDDSWRDGLIMSAWRPWLGHEWSMRDQSRSSEKHGVGITKAKFPRGTGDQHKAAVDEFCDALEMGSEGVVALEQGNEGEASFDIEPFEFNGSGFQAISDTMNANAVALAILLLGHNLTTEIKGGGSYAAAGVGEYIRDDIKHDDAQAEWACLGPQLATPYCMLNYGDPELTPIARYVTDSTTTNRAMAQMFQAIAAAIQTLRSNVPRFDVDAFCEQWNIPLGPVGSVQALLPNQPANDSAPPPAIEPDADDEEEAA